MGRDAVGGSYSADRRIEVIERFELDSGDDLVDVAADQDRLARDDAAAGLSNRGEDRLNVERNQTAQVDDLGLDALFGLEPLSRL